MGIIANLRRRVGAFFNAGYEGAASSRRLARFPTQHNHVNTLLSSAGKTLTARARYIVRNNGYGYNGVEAFTGNVIGAGIKPLILIKNKATKAKAVRLWNEFVDEADADGLTDFYGLQRRAAREVFIAGECFARFIARRPSDGLSMPFQIQLLPSEMLPFNKNEPIKGGGAIRQGIEFDARGRRVAYHFYKQHPDDRTEGGGSLSRTTETVRIPASEVIHIVDPMDVGQLRGASKIAPALVKLFLLDVYDDAELDKKKVNALNAYFITTQRAEDWTPPNDADSDDAEPVVERAIDLQPGAVVTLEPGETITPALPADSGSTYEPFQYRTLLQISAALGIPYPLLTNDRKGVNYSSDRSNLIEFRRRVEAFQHSVIVWQFCRPVLARFYDVAALSGGLSLPGYEARRKEYVRAPWLPPKFDWVDPLKDARAEIEQINAGLKSRSMAISERGYDAEDVDEQIAADRERERRLGLDFRPPAEQRASAGIGHNGGPPMNDANNGDGAAAPQDQGSGL